MTPLILDIATAGMADVEQYFDPVSAPSNYKDPAKIEAYKAEKEAEQRERAGLDPDLCVLTGAGLYCPRVNSQAIKTLKDTDEEGLIRWLAEHVEGRALVSYNGLKFDWPILMRRAMYLGVTFPTINLDRYRTPHIDLYDRLTYHGVIAGKSLRFYVNRFGWLDLEKPLSGAEESKVLQTQDWDGLRASIAHDVEATRRLAQKMGVL